MFLKPVGEILALHKIGHQVDPVFLAPHFVDLNDIGMTQLSRDPGFPDELLRVFCGQVALARNLDCHKAVQFRITCPPDTSECSGTQFVDNLEVAQQHALLNGRLLVYQPESIAA